MLLTKISTINAVIRFNTYEQMKRKKEAENSLKEFILKIKILLLITQTKQLNDVFYLRCISTRSNK